MKRKRPFLLLEVLIALSLVVLFSVPLLKSPLFLFRSEMESIKELEIRRLSELTFCEIKEKLYKREIPWDLETIPLTSAFLSLPGYEEKPLKRSITWKVYESEDKKRGKIYRKIRFELVLGDEEGAPYIFYVFLQKAT